MEPGTYGAIGKAEWDTVDRLPPDSGSAADVVRPVAVRVTQATGSNTTGDMDTLVPGGTIGCVTYRRQGVADVKVGDRVVLFLQSISTTDSIESIMATDAWVVRSDGIVATPDDGDLTVERLFDLATGP